MLFALTIGAGLATALQSACTSAQVKFLHNPYLVVLTSLLGSAVVVCAMALLTGGFGIGRADPGQVPWWAWLAGACGALVLLSQPIAAHALGAATYIGLFVSTSVTASVVLDHFGWLGFSQHPAGLWRLTGAAMMIGGVTLVSLF
jgi:bacterial/archaeal transporter family-2 protein